MNNKLTVYKQMTMSPTDLFDVLKQEIGIKVTCMPFAVKTIEALSSLGTVTEQQALKAANTYLDNLQTLYQGGIMPEDYDKIDMVKRGKVITLTARVEAFLRAAARKGYRITITIVAVPKEDANTTYFKENFYNGEIVYTLEDRRMQGDRKITAERIVKGYFDKYICRLEVSDIKQNMRLVMQACEMTNDEVLNAANASDSGIYKTKWEKYTDNYGQERNRKAVSNELNAGSIWNVWTSEMVAKTVIRRALKRIREVLPELKDTIYAFDNDSTEAPLPEEKAIEIPMKIEVSNVDLNNLSSEQKADASEMLNIFTANPKLASDKASEIMVLYESGKPLQEIINAHYASIVNICKSKKLRPTVQPFINEITAGVSKGDRK
ncbi:MAG: hypothetical protein RR087_07455 [Oscillospiraceae bacterium]